MTKRKYGPIGGAALAVLVLLVAMAGSATAGALITSKQIKDGSVTGKDLRDGSVTGKDVRDQSLTASDFAGSLEGPPGPSGPAGPPGPVGPPGPQGAAGLSGIEYRTAAMPVPGGQSRVWGAPCPSGKKVVGGGVSASDAFSVRIIESAPLDGGVGWTVGLHNAKSSAITGYAWAVCARAS